MKTLKMILALAFLAGNLPNANANINIHRLATIAKLNWFRANAETIQMLKLQASSDKKISSEIDAVTVFLQGAQVTRKGQVSLDKGVTKIIFEGLTQNFDPNSIRAKGTGNFIILDVSSNVFYPQPDPVVVTGIPPKIQKEIHVLEDSVADYGWKLSEIRENLMAYKEEKSILLNSGVIKGQVNNDSIAALKDALDYMRLKLVELNGIILKTQRNENQLQTHLNKMNNRLNVLRNYNNNAGHLPKNQAPVQQIIVTVSADLETWAKLELTYRVYDAGWTPAYDLRADNTDSPVAITYKANVFQRTGNDWHNAKIKLTTVNPNQTNYKPQLATWYIRYYQPIARQDYGAYKEIATRDKGIAPAAAPMAVDDGEGYNFENEDILAQHLDNFVAMNESMAMVEFELKIRHSIPSDGKEHLLAVAQKDIPSTYRHFIVPKLDKDAFLVARLTGWEDLNLLPGVANIYFDGTYVGQTRINPEVMSDTLDLALGRDRSVYMTRKKIRDEEKIKKIGNEKEKTVTFELAIKNYKAGSINLTIEDHVPVSQIEDIKVEVIKGEDAEYNAKLGFLTWKKELVGKATIKMQYTYVIKYDKDKTLAVN